MRKVAFAPIEQVEFYNPKEQVVANPPPINVTKVHAIRKTKKITVAQLDQSLRLAEIRAQMIKEREDIINPQKRQYLNELTKWKQAKKKVVPGNTNAQDILDMLECQDNMHECLEVINEKYNARMNH